MVRCAVGLYFLYFSKRDSVTTEVLVCYQNGFDESQASD